MLLILLLISNLMTILVFGVGAFWIYDGIHRGMTYYPLVGKSPARMAVVKVENRNHRRFFPDYVATGLVSSNTSTIEIPIFQGQYRRLRSGGSLEVLSLPSGGWLNRAKLEESMPIFSFLGLHFSWHFPAGVLMLGGWFGVLPYLRRKQNRCAKRGASPNGGPTHLWQSGGHEGAAIGELIVSSVAIDAPHKTPQCSRPVISFAPGKAAH